MSLGFNSANERPTFCSVRMFIICTVTAERRSDLLGLQQRRAEVDRDDHVGAHLSARCRPADCAPGRRRPIGDRPISTGATAPGTDIDARIACTTLPSFSTTISPVPMSVAIARNGIGSSSKLRALADLHQPSQLTFKRNAGDHVLSAADAVGRHCQLRHEVRRSRRPCAASSGPAAAGLSVKSRSVVIELITFSISDRQPGRVRGTDDRAHAGADDQIDRHAQLFENFQNADMGGAARAAAG